MAGQPAIYGRKIRYYDDPVFSERAKVHPPARSHRLVHDWSHWTKRASGAASEDAAPVTVGVNQPAAGDGLADVEQDVTTHDLEPAPSAVGDGRML